MPVRRRPGVFSGAAEGANQYSHGRGLMPSQPGMTMAPAGGGSANPMVDTPMMEMPDSLRRRITPLTGQVQRDADSNVLALLQSLLKTGQG